MNEIFAKIIESYERMGQDPAGLKIIIPYVTIDEAKALQKEFGDSCNIVFGLYTEISPKSAPGNVVKKIDLETLPKGYEDA